MLFATTPFLAPGIAWILVVIFRSLDRLGHRLGKGRWRGRRLHACREKYWFIPQHCNADGLMGDREHNPAGT